MKRIMALLLTIVMCFALCACGGSLQDSSNVDSSAINNNTLCTDDVDLVGIWYGSLFETDKEAEQCFLGIYDYDIYDELMVLYFLNNGYYLSGDISSLSSMLDPTRPKIDAVNCILRNIYAYYGEDLEYSPTYYSDFEEAFSANNPYLFVGKYTSTKNSITISHSDGSTETLDFDCIYDQSHLIHSIVIDANEEYNLYLAKCPKQSYDWTNIVGIWNVINSGYNSSMAQFRDDLTCVWEGCSTTWSISENVLSIENCGTSRFFDRFYFTLNANTILFFDFAYDYYGSDYFYGLSSVCIRA